MAGQPALPHVRQGAMPAQVLSSNSEQVDVTRSSSSVESGSNSKQNGKDKKKKGKLIKFFSTLGRKSKTSVDKQTALEERQTGKAQESSKIRHSQSQSIPNNVIGPGERAATLPYVPTTKVSAKAHEDSDPGVPREDDVEVVRADRADSVAKAAVPDTNWQSLATATHNRTVSSVSDRPMVNGNSTRTSPVRTMGMVNHGNSCFMNAVVQCLRHTDTLARFFALEAYKHGGASEAKNGLPTPARSLELSDAFAALISALWRADYVSADSLKLKKLAGRLCAQYDSAAQQDAQEFLLWLLDALDDELRCALGSQRRSTNGYSQELPNGVSRERSITEDGEKRQKRVSTNLQYVEAFRRNGSELWRYVAGFYESTLVCPVCSKMSVTYEPFTCLSLPLAQRNIYVVDVLYPRPLTHLTAPSSSLSAKQDVHLWQVRIACPINTVENVRHLKSYLLAQRVLRLRQDQTILLVDVPNTLKWIKSLPDTTKLGDLEHTHFHAFVIDPPLSSSTAPSSILPDSNGNTVNTNGNLNVNGSTTTDSDQEARVSLIVINVERYHTLSKDSQVFIRQFVRPLMLTGVSRAISYWQLFSDIVQTMLCMRERRSNFAKLRSVTPELLRRYLQESNAEADIYAVEDETDQWVRLDNKMDMPLLSEVADRLIACSAGAPVPHLKIVIEWDSQPRTLLNQLASPSNYFVAALSVSDEMQLGVYEDVSVSELLPTAVPNASRPVGLGTASLTECLKMNFREENLGSDDAWLCPQCRKPQAGSTKKLSLCSLPDLFIVHLKRFRQTDGNRAKLDFLVDFPLDGLDMSAFCTDRHTQVRIEEPEHCSSVERFGSRNGPHPLLAAVQFDSESDTDEPADADSASVASEYEYVDGSNAKQFRARQKGVRLRDGLPSQNSKRPPDSMIFDLVAVVNHFGTLQSGHYTAFCRYPHNGLGNSEASRDLWFAYDDQTVSPKRPAEICTPAAYLLFYQKRSSSAQNSTDSHWSTLLPARSLPVGNEYPEIHRPNGSSDSLRRLPDAHKADLNGKAGSFRNVNGSADCHADNLSTTARLSHNRAASNAAPVQNTLDCNNAQCNRISSSSQPNADDRLTTERRSVRSNVDCKSNLAEQQASASKTRLVNSVQINDGLVKPVTADLAQSIATSKGSRSGDSRNLTASSNSRSRNTETDT